MKKILIISGIIIAVLIGGIFISRGVDARGQSNLLEDLNTFEAKQGTLSLTIGAKGYIYANQSAVLFWEIPGQVDELNVTPGMQVSAGQVLATLETTSLPAYIILAQSDLVTAQKALEDLLQSQSQQAGVLKALDDANRALEDALNPELAQAQVLVEIANAQAAVESTQRQLDILTAPVPQSAINQSYANLVLAEDKLESTKETIEKITQQLKFAITGIPAFMPGEIKVKLQAELRQTLRQSLEGLHIQLTQNQLAYESSLNRYNQLLIPPDPIEVTVAEAKLAAAKVQLADAKREWERIQNGPSTAEIAVLEATVADARREWERLKDGPDPDDIAIMEARIAASQAALKQIKITAPFDGTITRVDAQIGDLVNPGTLAFHIDDVSHLLVDLKISEIDIPLVRVGQDVILTFDSVLAKEYKGEVVEIAMVGTESLGAITFNVRVELLEIDENIRMGMTSDVNIVTREKENVLLVPNRSVRILDGEKVVYVLSAGNVGIGESDNIFEKFTANNPAFRPVRVELGETANFLSEVIDGELKPGDRVAIDPPEELTNIPQRQSSSGFVFRHP